MTAYDACFFAIAIAVFSGDLPRRWWLAAFAPLVAWGVGLAPLGSVRAPLAALIVSAPVIRMAPCALLLAVPSYDCPFKAAFFGALWLGVTLAFKYLAARLDGEAVPGRLRGAPARFIALSVAYFGLQPAGLL